MKAILTSLLSLVWVAASLPAAEPVDYVRDVKPLLAQHCYRCHGPEQQKSGLRLDSAAAILQGGNTEPAIKPGKSAESLLFKAISGVKGVKLMPPPKEPRLSARDIALLKSWIDQGARAPAHETVAAPGPSSSKHWAFRMPAREAPPLVKDRAWARNPLDDFILARLEQEGIAPAPPADRVTLLRRLSLDLIGLPPTAPEIDAFLADTRPGAYERVVDRLLASPHYGERWGRHWLDLARYADSNGFTIDAPRSIWMYRDWVIKALNRDMPFDQFTIEQLAGDLLPGATLEQQIATGFHRNTLLNEEGGIDLEQFRVEAVVDRANTTGAVFLGLTVGCAQCHDHKFDPLTQREYYQLYAFFNSTDDPNLEVPAPGQLEQRARLHARIAPVQKRLKELDTTSAAGLVAWEKGVQAGDKSRLPASIQDILALPDNGRTASQAQTLLAFYRKMDQARYAMDALGDRHGLLAAAALKAAVTRTALEQQIAALRKQEPRIVTTLVLHELPTARPTYIQLGGDFLRKGAAVAPAVPGWLPALPVQGKPPTRLDLARWLVDGRNPLTARVTMNRFWQHHFGIGLVETENDFGTQGSRPTHPELLDWLANEFVASKWSMKAMHRLIVTSATYRQSSQARPELATIDPRNRLLARQSRLRLEAESVRDAALVASGLFAPKIGGPSVFPPQPPGLYRFTQIPREWHASTGPDRYRRGLYTYFWRSAPHPSLTVFDAPDSTTTCTRRTRSNTPLQALTLLNDEACIEFAEALARRVLAAPPADDAARMRYAFQLCLARDPSRYERQRLLQLLDQQLAARSDDVPHLVSGKSAQRPDSGRLAGWVAVARVLLNLDEFMTRE